MANDSIRDALTSAIATHSSNDAADESVDEADDTSLNETVDDSAPDSPPDESSDTQDESADETASPSEGGEPAAKATAAPEVAAPASWSNEERAAWATVPPAARAAIQRREGEMNRVLQHSAGARKRVEKLDKITADYKPLLDSYGISAEDAMPTLLATRAVLEIGTPQQKATLLANVCADFGIDIQELDNALTARYQGGVPTPRYNGQPQAAPDFRADPNLAPLYAMAEQVNENRRAQAQTLVDSVKADPHFETVRHTMADLIDQAKANGREIDLPTALRLARELHGLGPPARARGTGNPVSDAARTLALSRKAASSVSGAPKPSLPRKPGEGTLRDEIIANMGRKSR